MEYCDDPECPSCHPRQQQFIDEEPNPEEDEDYHDEVEPLESPY
jgi:hypothetical protein